MYTQIKKLLKTFVGKLIFVIAFVAAFWVVKEGKQAFVHSTAMENASVKAAETINQEIQTAQAQATSTKSATDVLAERAKKNADATLAATNTDKQKRVVASNFFFGAYFLNTRTRPAYCASLGEPIPSFAKAYESHHRNLFNAAERIQIQDFKDHKAEYDIEKFYALFSPSTEKVVAQDMKDAALALKMSEKEICSSMQQNANVWVKEMDYQKQVPDVAQLLLKN